ncbi:beta-galactosidase [Flavobacterium sp. L1I52]|uniref:Beta-galactosidase n=1 Tax=Flavobacterium pokkalii TaxID=1940408 RepID=A0ABR7UTZ2_9FLAO|nr:beta-galactosidase [Flavobacterium pokkalii]MBD0725842.1 beta-galactosidase [Flavobacterium pokkalii]
MNTTLSFSFSFILFFSVTFFGKAQNSQSFFLDKDLSKIGVYYYPEHWSETQWERDFKKMAEMGFEFTHFAEFAWAQLEPQEGVYDFKWLDRAVELAAKYNLKVIICTSTATPPVWLVRAHPEVLKTNYEGTVEDLGSRQHASFSNEYYRSYSLKMIAELAKHYGKDKRIIGWQLDNEPRSNVDYGKDAQIRFRKWLKNKYGSIDALNTAWGTNFWSGTYSDFEQINLPNHKQWGINLYQTLDHTRFCDDETATFLDDQARTIKECSTNQWITSNYIPMYDVRYIGASKELDFVSYTRYMVYGEGKGVGKKGYRLGDYLRIAMANDYFRPMSKDYGVMELQPGQVNWGKINSQPLPGAVRLWLWNVFAGGSKFECAYRFRAPIYGYEQYHYGILSYDGVTPTPGGLEYQQFAQEIKKLRKEYAGAVIPDFYLKRKTAVLYNPDNTVAINQNKQTTEWDTESHVLKYYGALKSFGAPVDFIREDVDFSQYPVLVVPAYQQIDKALIVKLTNYAKNGGILVISCRTGHQDKQGHLWEAQFAEPIYDLIGSKIKFYDLLPRDVPDEVKLDDKSFSWSSWGEILSPFKGTEVWANYKGDFYSDRPAVVHRAIGKGWVTYIGVDTQKGELEYDVLKRVFNKANIFTESYPEGILVEYRDGFGIAMNYSDKKRIINLPENSKILIGQKELETAAVLVWKIK